jgi:cell division protein FtsI/penicillin-binding protein 2
MMKRVERPGGKGASGFASRLKIPKKGRIRIALILVILIAVVKIFSGRGSSAGAISHHAMPLPEPIQRDMPQKSLPAAPESKPEPTLKQHASILGSLGFGKETIPENNFQASDLSDLLRRHPPRLNAATDTILANNKSYVLHYSFDSTVERCGHTLLKQYHPKYGALVAMESATGRVLALVSYTRDSEPSLGDNLFDRSLFPAASVFKTITASAAIEKANMNPESKMPLAGRRYTLYKFQLKEDLRAYEPVSLQDAYAFSINPIFGRIGVFVLGPSIIREYMGKFGFNCQIPFELDNEKPVAAIADKDSALLVAEIASGFNQKTRISPLYGAMLASSVSENGRMPEPFFVDSVTCGDSCVVYRAAPHMWREPIRQSTADVMKGMMSRVAQYGTARTAFRYIKHSSSFDNIAYGGKTGTVDEDKLGKIDWFVGFASNPSDPKQRIAVGVVTVHDQFWTVHSSYIAAEIFRKYIKEAQVSEKAARAERLETKRIKAEG